ncbi:MAG: hypothetical protein WA892_01170 [Ornithinimicrobium sp.]
MTTTSKTRRPFAAIAAAEPSARSRAGREFPHVQAFLERPAAQPARFVDAHEASADFGLMTRSDQDNNSQRWIMAHVGTVYTLRQESTGRYLDAHTNRSDFSAVTRPGRDRDGQR